MAEPANTPISPWADRFGVTDSYPWKDENKSGLHPTYPEIDLRYPNTLSPEARINLRLGIGLPQPSDPDLDRLFLDEAYQRSSLEGYLTGQAVLFGALQNAQPMSATVDEANWLPLFAKQRWYNLNRPLADGWRGTLDSRLAENATWSVDNPVLWERLSPAIELADRFIRATVHHPFLDAILGVKAADVYPNQTQAEGLETRPRLAKNNTPPLLSEKELLDTLGRYAEKIVISFIAPGMGGSLGGSYGLTTSLADPNLGGRLNGQDFVLMLIHPVFVWRLLDPRESTCSRAQVTLSFAVTLAHEMMHAINRVRNMFAPEGEVLQEEPFYAPPGTRPEDSAWISELGASWEQSIIGGSLVERPYGEDTFGGLFMFSTDIPNYGLAEAYSKGIDLDRHRDDPWYCYAMPAFVAQLYGSDEFWQTHVVKYGLAALHTPKLFRTEMEHSSGAGHPEICHISSVLPEFRPKLEEHAERLKTRMNQLRLLRPWYHEKETEWRDTPYSRSWLRSAAPRFRIAHRKGDEWVGQKCYRALGAYEEWGDVFTENGFLLDQDQDWVDRAVAYLMLVIMPIRAWNFTKQIPYFPEDEHVPSAAAIAGAAARSVKPFQLALAGGDGDWDEVHLVRRNVAFAPNTPNNLMGTRATLMAILKDEIPNRQRQHPIPDPVYQALKAMFDNVNREAPNYQIPDKWLSNQIDFVLPPWQAEQAQKTVGYSPSSPYVPYNPSAQPQQHFPGAATPPHQGPLARSGQSSPAHGSPDSSRSLASAVHSPPPHNLGTPTGAGSLSSPQYPAGRVAHVARRAPIALDEVYHTVGEVGDHISTGDLWVIADDGAHGYDVYDATDVVEEMWADDHAAFSLDEHCERTLLGLKARPRLKEKLEVQAERLGKLIMPMRRHEIAERDGRHGKPLWISVGNDVFDISDFPFESDKQRSLMTVVPGGNPWKAVVKDGTIDFDQLVVDLKPYRCAVVASHVPNKGPGPAVEFHFTVKEVACHVYPETTMYTIIRGQVYNLTGYMDLHPGGRTILRRWAGRDSTQEFERYHTDADRCLADYDYLRVGRIVAEKSMDQLTRNEVALNGNVYDLGRIGNGEPGRRLASEIDSRGLRSKDITPVLNNGLRPPPESLLLLPRMPDLITAKLATPLLDIDQATLRANDGSHMPLPEGMKVPRSRVEADLQMPLWVSCGGLVYDMTAVSKWGPEDVKAQLNGHDHRYRGAVIPPSEFATRLQREYGCRVIGRLVRNSGRPRDEGEGEGEGEGGAGDGEDRAHQKPRLR